MNQQRVDILLSIYNPNMEYLRKQLQSLNSQTYEHIKLYVFDDCVHNRCDTSVFEECITNFAYELLPYEKENLNYVKAFQKLIEFSDGEFIAFCDQDDIWENEKISECIKVLQQDEADLVACDYSIIDKHDQVLYKSVAHQRTSAYDLWKTGDDIAKYNCFMTKAPGMALVIRKECALNVLPIPDGFAHDNWMLSSISVLGKVAYLDKPLVQYRRHGNNVSGALVGVHSKKDYYDKRIQVALKKVDGFVERYPNYSGCDEMLQFVNARKNGNIKRIYNYRYLSPCVAKFEIVYNVIPNFLFKIILKFIK